jgi:hypothetical protein
MADNKFICDCGKQYKPPAKYRDDRVRCAICIKSIRASEIKTKCIQYLGGRCTDCGFEGHPVAFDFDHKDPSKKEFKISGSYLFRWKVLKMELDKCELRCSNCHRIKHYLESEL